MQIVDKIKPWLSRRSVRTGSVLFVVVVLVVLFNSANDNLKEEAEFQGSLVTLTTAAEYVGQQELSLIGTARAFTEAQVTSERAGRVTSVNVSLGQFVAAGQVLATLDNASERAAVLQAEGVYDAAVAATAQSEVGVEQAKTNLKSARNAAVSTYQSAYNTTNNVFLNSIDDFFSNADTARPGLRIDGRGLTAELNTERAAFQSVLSLWQGTSNTISTESDLETELQSAKNNVQRTITFLDTFLTIFADQDSGSRYTKAELDGFIAEFTGLKTMLIGQQSSINGALSGLSSAQESLRRAELSSTGGTTSAADAQIKQALGMLRAAQANLAKTILRTPISGTINSLSVKTGDFLGSFTKIAVVANNSALEIVTYVSENERNLISIGDVVTIEGKHSGVVTQIAPSVDSETRKIEVRIATESTDIVNGDTVRITKESSAENVSLENIEIPLSAVKFESENGYVFLVENNKLVSRPVVLGVVRGGSVIVTEGLSSDDSFVKDARGLTAGTEVEVNK